MNSFNSLKHMQQFDAHHSNQKKEKKTFNLQFFGTRATLQIISKTCKCILTKYEHKSKASRNDALRPLNFEII